MDLNGKLLIAMPGMGDPRFEHSVIFLCSHSDEGAMGLIINKPAKGVSLNDLLTQLELDGESPDLGASPVHFGGPVETARGFVLHSSDYASNLHSLAVSDAFSMTATLDILEDMAAARGPRRALLMLGYSGWGAGQLEDEISQNAWLTTEASPDLVFATEDGSKWEAALRTLGVDPVTLSASAGHA